MKKQYITPVIEIFSFALEGILSNDISHNSGFEGGGTGGGIYGDDDEDNDNVINFYGGF